ncbi:helix-turn-helix domain-containing protein [Streptomyces sp. SID4945]|nr:helix-turn-helix domain-containing protein [Streptomyces sp. SID4945]
MRPHGSAIRYRRQALKQSLRDVAAATGLDRSHLSRVERGLAGLSDDNLHRLAEALLVSIPDITHDPGDTVSTATAPKRRARLIRIRENLPTPSAPEGELFHYTPDEAAIWLPFSARKLREMAYLRQIPHVNNGNRVWFSGQNIRAITTQFTQPALRPAA